MINREWQSAVLIRYANTVDDYGQTRQTIISRTNIEIVFHFQTQIILNNPLYEGIQAIGLTKHTSVLVGDTININGDNYIVQHILPGKYYQLFLKNE